MPTAAIFLAGRGVLRTNHRRPAEFPARDADIAADADADVVVPAFLDLFRQPRIGNGGARRADDVGDSLGDDLSHLFRIGKSPDSEYRLLGHLLHETGPRHLVALGIETRRAGILAPFGDVAHIDVPQVDQRIGHA